MKKAGGPSSPSKGSARRGFFRTDSPPGLFTGRVLRRQRCVAGSAARPAVIVAHVGLIMRTHGGTARAAGLRGPDVASIRWVWHDNALAASAPARAAARITARAGRARGADGDAAAGSSPAGPAVFLYSCVGTDGRRRRHAAPLCAALPRLGVPTDASSRAPASFRTRPRPAAARARAAATRRARRSRARRPPPAALRDGRARSTRGALRAHLMVRHVLRAEPDRVRRAIFAALSASARCGRATGSCTPTRTSSTATRAATCAGSSPSPPRARRRARRAPAAADGAARATTARAARCARARAPTAGSPSRGASIFPRSRPRAAAAEGRSRAPARRARRAAGACTRAKSREHAAARRRPAASARPRQRRARRAARPALRRRRADRRRRAHADGAPVPARVQPQGERERTFPLSPPRTFPSLTRARVQPPARAQDHGAHGRARDVAGEPPHPRALARRRALPPGPAARHRPLQVGARRAAAARAARRHQGRAEAQPLGRGGRAPARPPARAPRPRVRAVR